MTFHGEQQIGDHFFGHPHLGTPNSGVGRRGGFIEDGRHPSSNLVGDGLTVEGFDEAKQPCFSCSSLFGVVAVYQRVESVKLIGNILVKDVVFLLFDPCIGHCLQHGRIIGLQFEIVGGNLFQVFDHLPHHFHFAFSDARHDLVEVGLATADAADQSDGKVFWETNEKLPKILRGIDETQDLEQVFCLSAPIPGLSLPTSLEFLNDVAEDNGKEIAFGRHRTHGNVQVDHHTDPSQRLDNVDVNDVARLVMGCDAVLGYVLTDGTWQ